MKEPTQVQKIIRTHSILLFNTRTHHAASGVFILFNQIYFVVTVAHIFEHSGLDDVVVNLGIMGQRYPMKKFNFWKDDSLDMCYFQLDQFEVATFTKLAVPFVFKSEIFQRGLKPSQRAMICGFPVSLSKITEEKLFVAQTYFNTTQILPPDQWPSAVANFGKNPQQHFLLKFGPSFGGRFRNQDGELTEPEPPFGLSGAGVWFVDLETENAEKPTFSLFGIQTGLFPKQEALCGSFIKPVIDHIKVQFGAAA